MLLVHKLSYFESFFINVPLIHHYKIQHLYWICVHCSSNASIYWTITANNVHGKLSCGAWHRMQSLQRWKKNWEQSAHLSIYFQCAYCIRCGICCVFIVLASGIIYSFRCRNIPCMWFVVSAVRSVCMCLRVTMTKCNILCARILMVESIGNFYFSKIRK